jgi:hypothetical protein
LQVSILVASTKRFDRTEFVRTDILTRTDTERNVEVRRYTRAPSEMASEQSCDRESDSALACLCSLRTLGRDLVLP